jgi:hypothetical protein
MGDLLPYVFDRRDYVRYGFGRNNYCDSGDCVARASRVKQKLEGARIQTLQRGHQRTAKQPNVELLPPVKAATKKKNKDCRHRSRETTPFGKDSSGNPQAGVTS